MGILSPWQPLFGLVTQRSAQTTAAKATNRDHDRLLNKTAQNTCILPYYYASDREGVTILTKRKNTLSSISDIALRLVGSSLPYAGRVEVRYAGVWGLICPLRMNGTVFKVICRQLGFADVMGDSSLYGRPEYPNRRFRLYGQGNGPIWLSKVRCHGNESSLSECEIESPGVSFWCIHSETLELMCRTKNFTPRKYS